MTTATNGFDKFSSNACETGKVHVTVVASCCFILQALKVREALLDIRSDQEVGFELSRRDITITPKGHNRNFLLTIELQYVSLSEIIES